MLDDLLATHWWIHDGSGVLRRCDCGSLAIVTPLDDPPWCQPCLDAAAREMEILEAERTQPCFFLTEVVPWMVQQAHMERLGWVKRDDVGGEGEA